MNEDRATAINRLVDEYTQLRTYVAEEVPDAT